MYRKHQLYCTCSTDTLLQMVPIARIVLISFILPTKLCFISNLYIQLRLPQVFGRQKQKICNKKYFGLVFFWSRTGNLGEFFPLHENLQCKMFLFGIRSSLKRSKKSHYIILIDIDLYVFSYIICCAKFFIVKNFLLIKYRIFKVDKS